MRQIHERMGELKLALCGQGVRDQEPPILGGLRWEQPLAGYCQAPRLDEVRFQDQVTQ